MKKIVSFLLAILMLTSFGVPVTAEEQPSSTVASYRQGKEIEVDGMMGEDEGWQDALTFDYSIHAKDSNANTYVKRSEREGVAGEASLKVTHDGEYLYFYYETTNTDTLTTEYYNDPEHTGTIALQGPSLYLRVVPVDGANMSAAHGYNDGTFFHIRLNVGNEVAAVNEDKVGSVYDFTFVHGLNCNKTECQNKTTCAWGLGTKTPINQFGFDGYYESWGDYSTSFAKDTTIALHVEKDATGTPVKKAYEIKMPLSDTYKNRIGNGEPTFYLATAERSYQYNGTVKEGWNLISLDGETPVEYNNSTSNVTAIPVTLEMPKSEVIPIGIQTRTNPQNEGAYDVRFVSVVNEYTGFTFAQSRLGYLFRKDDVEREQYCTKVYKQISYTKKDGSDGYLDASDYGGKYFFCFTISNFEKNATNRHSFQFSCFTQRTATEEKIYCDRMIEIDIFYDAQADKPVVEQPSVNDSLIDLSGYQIVIPRNAHLSSVESLSAYELKDALGGLGASLSVNSENVVSSIAQKSILLGNTSATETDIPAGNGFLIKEDANGRIQIAAGNYYGYRAALAYIVEQGGIPKGVNHTGTATVANTDRATSDSLRVMFYNVLYDEHWYNLADEKVTGNMAPPLGVRQSLQRDLIALYAPDVIGFQEFNYNSYHAKFDSIMQSLGYTEVMVNGVSNKPYPIFYRADKVTLVECGEKIYSSPEESHKGFTWAVFKENATNKQFAVFNTHFWANGDNQSSEYWDSVREANANEILVGISDIKSRYENIAVIMGGDLNFWNSWPTYNTESSRKPYLALTGGGLTLASNISGVKTNFWTSSNTTNYTNSYHGYYYYDPVKKIYDLTKSNLKSMSKNPYTLDYIFFDNLSSITVKQYFIIEDDITNRASDHCPTIADIILK